jgi:ATP adenylyltransferase
MVVPYQHLSTPEEMAPADLVEMFTLMNRALVILRENFCPNGFNIGMNIGKSAGAGVKDHFHLHVVPRWAGDANFMATIGETKVLSYELDHVHSILRRGFET